MAAPVTAAAVPPDPDDELSPSPPTKSYAESIKAPPTPDALPSVSPPPPEKVGLPKRLADTEQTEPLTPPETPSRKAEPTPVEARSRNPLDDTVFDDEERKSPGAAEEGDVDTEEEEEVVKVSPLKMQSKEGLVVEDKGEVSPVEKHGATASGDESGETTDIGESVVLNKPAEKKDALLTDYTINGKTVIEDIPALVSHVPHRQVPLYLAWNFR